MELAIVITVGVLFTILGFGCVLSIVLGLPGSWMLLALAAVVELADGLYLSPDDPWTFDWRLLVACVVLATIGEILELIAGALGAKRAGSSRRGMVGALVGGILGALAGIGIPIPVVGSLIGAVIGTFVGAILGEMGDGRLTMRGSLKPAAGATVGRVLGTLAKVPIGAAIWVALSVAAFWR